MADNVMSSAFRCKFLFICQHILENTDALDLPSVENDHANKALHANTCLNRDSYQAQTHTNLPLKTLRASFVKFMSLT